MSEGKNFFEKLADKLGNTEPISRGKFLEEAGKAVVNTSLVLGAGFLMQSCESAPPSRSFELGDTIPSSSELPEIIKDKKNIESYINNLGENERVELKKCFGQYVEYYKLIKVEEFDEEKLKIKFYGLCATFLPSFIYKNEAPKRMTATFNHTTNTITYQSLPVIDISKKSEKETNEDVIFEELLFKPNSSFAKFLSELAHAINRINLTDEQYSLVNTKDYHRAQDSIRVNKFEEDSRYFFYYSDITFHETETHGVTDPALALYLFEVLDFKKQQFGEYLDFLNKIKNSIKNIKINNFYHENYAKTIILKSIANPKTLRLLKKREVNEIILTKRITLINELFFEYNLSKDESHGINNYLSLYKKLIHKDYQKLMETEEVLNIYKQKINNILNIIINSNFGSKDLIEIQSFVEKFEDSLLLKESLKRLILKNEIRKDNVLKKINISINEYDGEINKEKIKDYIESLFEIKIYKIAD